MHIQESNHEAKSIPVSDHELVLFFTALDRSFLPLVGGKAANLGELTRAGFPVPPGFCLTTAAYALVAQRADLVMLLEELAAVSAHEAARLRDLAAQARSILGDVPLPASVATVVARAYQSLSVNGETVPVAVRSSATAEDLPFASFAGQQDTYLNVVGVEAVLDAIRRCWASLWTDRAVIYRASKGIDPRTVRLAVIVQPMVDASVAGVLFTANPLTGHRRQAVIDASLGLGEAVVSGAVDPDHFIVNTATGEIIERRLGAKRLLIQSVPGGGTQHIEQEEAHSEACLSEKQIHALARLGASVEQHYQEPQDTEWAIDGSGQLWLLQARPITTLYPLPAHTPRSDDMLEVYFSFNVAQGVYRPLTPMSLSIFCLAGSAIAKLFGVSVRDPRLGPPAYRVAGQRIFLNVTTPLRNPIGRSLLVGAMRFVEARSGPIFQQLLHDPRLALIPASRWQFFRAVMMPLLRAGVPLYLLRTLCFPQKARVRAMCLAKAVQEENDLSAYASATERLASVEQVIPRYAFRIFSQLVPVVVVGMASLMISHQLLSDLASEDEFQHVLRSLPHNITIEMDLALWQMAQNIRPNEESVQAIQQNAPEQLAWCYLNGTLPSLLQQQLAHFLKQYGHRGVAEIDLGLPRWSENPQYILGMLANYLQITDPAMAPDVQFRRGKREAEEMVMTLTRRARRRGWLRSALVGFFLRRVRSLLGMREMPKFCLIALQARVRKLLQTVGEELVAEGRLTASEDIFFLTISEAYEAVAGKSFQDVVRGRRASYDDELSRKYVPRVLLSDGTMPVADEQEEDADGAILRGTPASAGRVSSKARVILNPLGAHLEPGEILVAPSTDPGWTPLFLTAAGLVMEMGGPMSHGAVVAREYGIPAVVGLSGATECIIDGQRITVDGSAGTVVQEPLFFSTSQE